MLKTILALLCLTFGCSAAVAESGKRCSFANPTYSLKVKECRDRIEAECKTDEDGIPVQDCPALVECRAWKAKECAK